MDKQFEKVIKTMETQNEKVGNLQKHISSLFEKNKTVQKETDGKLKKINMEIYLIIHYFHMINL